MLSIFAAFIFSLGSPQEVSSLPRLHLVDLGGDPVAGAEVWVVRSLPWGGLGDVEDPIPWIQSHGSLQRSDAQGGIDLMPGDELALVYAETNDLVCQLPWGGAYLGMGPGQEIRRNGVGDAWLRMVPKWSTSIQVLDAKGLPVSSAKVTNVTPAATDTPALGASAWSSRLEPDGWAHFDLAGATANDLGIALHYGQMKVGVWPDHGPAQEFWVPLGLSSTVTLAKVVNSANGGTPDLDKQKDAQDPSLRKVRVTGRLLSPFGEPHPGGILQTWPEPTPVEPGGHFTLELEARQSPRSVSCQVGPMQISWPYSIGPIEADSESVDLGDLEPSARSVFAEGIVLDAAGKVAPHVRVQVHHANTGGEDRAVGTWTDEQGRFWLAGWGRAVSYTHLTLPTICSV